MFNPARKLAFLLSFVVLLHFANAQNVSIGFNVTESACPRTASLLDTVTNLPACITEAFFSSLTSGFIYASEQFLSASFNFILAVPDLHWFCGPYNAVMSVIESLYIVVLMGLGFYYIARSNDVAGRMAAKRWLKNVFFMVVALSLSFYMFELLIDLNQYIASEFMSKAKLDFFSVGASFSSVVFLLILSASFAGVFLITFVTLLIRYILIPFLLLAFPIALFLYFIPPTQSWGKVMLQVIAIVVFMTSFDSLILLALSSLFHSPDPNLAGDFVRSMAVLLGFSALGLLNISLFLLALLLVVLEGLRAIGEILMYAVRVAMIASFL